MPHTSRRRFMQFLAGSPLAAAGGSALAQTLLPKSRLPDPLMWGPLEAERLIKAPKDPEGGDQRVRFRAGDAPERAAGAFRLHGLGHRR